HASDPPRPAWVAPRNRETMTEGLGEREQLLQATGLRAVRLDTRRRTAGSRRGPLCCEGRVLDSVGEKAKRATRRVGIRGAVRRGGRDASVDGAKSVRRSVGARRSPEAVSRLVAAERARDAACARCSAARRRERRARGGGR